MEPVVPKGVVEWNLRLPRLLLILSAVIPVVKSLVTSRVLTVIVVRPDTVTKERVAF